MRDEQNQCLEPLFKGNGRNDEHDNTIFPEYNSISYDILKANSVFIILYPASARCYHKDTSFCLKIFLMRYNTEKFLRQTS